MTARGIDQVLPYPGDSALCAGSCSAALSQPTPTGCARPLIAAANPSERRFPCEPMEASLWLNSTEG